MTPNYIKMTEHHFSELTKGLKKVADHLLSDPMIFATHPAKKVGEIIGVSETMVIRFCNSINYKGFSPLQKDVRKHLLNLNQKSSENNNGKGALPNTFVNSMAMDMNNLQQNIDTIDVEKLELIIETVMNSEKVVVAGYYHSFTYAHWFYFNLNYILRNAELYRPETDVGLLDLLPERSCIIVFSFYRYALDTLRLAEEAKSKNIKVITITDSRVAPIADYADIVIPIHMAQGSLLSKGPVTLSVVNSILYEIIQRAGEKGDIHSSLKYFIKDVENEY